MLRVFVPGAWRENDRIRHDASANLVDAALATGAARFIQESFAPTYADNGDAWIDESVPLKPVHYNRTILDAEASARRFTHRGGGTGVVLRFAAFYGPDAYQLGDMVALVRRGWAPLLGPADSYMSSVSHDDAAAAVVAALDVQSGAYNVSDDEPLRHRDFADALAAALVNHHRACRPRGPRTWPDRWAALLARSLRVSNAKLRAATAGRRAIAACAKASRRRSATFPPREPRRRHGETAVRA